MTAAGVFVLTTGAVGEAFLQPFKATKDKITTTHTTVIFTFFIFPPFIYPKIITSK
jgi:hypothetical protein